MSKSTEYSESGNPIYRYSDRQNEWRPPEYGEEKWGIIMITCILEEISIRLSSNYGLFFVPRYRCQRTRT